MKPAAKQKKDSTGQQRAMRAIRQLCPVLHLESATREEFCLFEPILEDLPVGVTIVDPRGKFTVFNREARRILGIGPKQVDYTEWAQVYGCYRADKEVPYSPESLPLARALRGEPVTDELMFIRNSAQPQGVWIRVSCRPLVGIPGQEGWAMAVFTDVTERRKAVEKIELLSRAVEQTADSVLITDHTGQIEYVNPAFESTTGYSRNDAIGNTPRILKSGLHDTNFYQQLWREIRSGNPFRGTLRNRKKNGELYWAEQTITPLTNDTGQITHFVSVLKDMTEARAREEEQIQMALAREVQQRFYSNSVTMSGIDIGAAIHPAEQTGGDYVDFIRTAEDCLALAVGDVNGHGFVAALVMALTRAYVRAFCGQGLGVGKVLNGVDRMLNADLEESRYVTMLLVSLDLTDRMLSYASAGHVPGYVLNRAGDVEEVLSSTGMPLGLLAGNRIGTRLVKLQSGQMIVLTTDGLAEASAAEPGESEEFGGERVLEYVREHRAEPAHRIAEGLYECARDYACHQPQQDDVAVVIVKVE